LEFSKRALSTKRHDKHSTVLYARIGGHTDTGQRMKKRGWGDIQAELNIGVFGCVKRGNSKGPWVDTRGLAGQKGGLARRRSQNAVGHKRRTGGKLFFCGYISMEATNRFAGRYEKNHRGLTLGGGGDRAPNPRGKVEGDGKALRGTPAKGWGGLALAKKLLQSCWHESKTFGNIGGKACEARNSRSVHGDKGEKFNTGKRIKRSAKHRHSGGQNCENAHSPLMQFGDGVNNWGRGSTHQGGVLNYKRIGTHFCSNTERAWRHRTKTATILHNAVGV